MEAVNRRTPSLQPNHTDGHQHPGSRASKRLAVRALASNLHRQLTRQYAFQMRCKQSRLTTLAVDLKSRQGECKEHQPRRRHGDG